MCDDQYNEGNNKGPLWKILYFFSTISIAIPYDRHTWWQREHNAIVDICLVFAASLSTSSYYTNYFLKK